MKKSFICLLCLLTIAACKKDDDVKESPTSPEEEQQDIKLTFSSSLPTYGLESKATFGKTDGQLYWSSYDDIGVYAYAGAVGTGSKTHGEVCDIATTAIGQTSAEFTSQTLISSWLQDGADTYRFYAYYPEEGELKTENNGNVEFSLASEQDGEFGHYQISYASTQNCSRTDIEAGKTISFGTFTPATTIVRLCPKIDEDVTTETVTITKISMTIPGATVTGNATLSLTDGTLTPAAAGGDSTVTVNLEDNPLTLAKEDETGHVDIVIFPTSSISGDITFSVEASDSVNIEKITAPEGGFAAGKRYDINCNITPEHNNYINNAEELVAFAGRTDLTVSDLYYLGNDIDMSGVEWTPFTLNCTLDGKDHKIYNLNVNGSSFISEVASGAALKNVTIGSQDGTTYDGTSAITLAAGTTGQIRVGVISNNNGTVENVRNFAAINALGGTGNETESRVGGIVASNYSLIKDCDNNGVITVSGSYSTNTFVGGITGWASDGTGTIENSNNRGAINIDNDMVLAAAGIVGMLRGEDILNCNNYGTITATNSHKTDPNYFGGIVGFTMNIAAEKRISGCTNEGSFVITSPKLTGVGGIVGAIHLACKSAMNLESCTNKADISVSATNTNMYMGGILARVAMPGKVSAAADVLNKISNCTNEGDISLGNENTSCSGVAYIGGIAGAAAKDFTIENCNNNGAVSSVKLTDCWAGGILGYADCEDLTVSGNTVTGSVTLNPDQSVATGCYAGGIIGFTSSNNVIIQNNNNNASTVSVSCQSKAAMGKPLSYVGGIIGASDDVASSTSNNRNNAAVSSNTQATWVPTGGLVGMVLGSITMTDDINFADVTTTSTHTRTQDIFCGGVSGLFNMGGSADTKGEEKALLNRVKTFGDIVSSGLVGLVGNSAWGNYGELTLTDCVVGGSVTGKDGVRKEASSFNVAAGGGLFGYKNNNNTIYKQTGTTLGDASDYQ